MNFNFALAAAATLLAATAQVIAVPTAGTGSHFKGPVGLQLYSLRDDFAKNVPGTLDRVRDYGFKIVELAGTYGMAPEKFRAELESRGLKPIAGHFGFEQYRDNPEAVAKEAKALGLKYTGCAWVPHNGPFTQAACDETAAVFNRAGEVLAKHGLRFFYHVHGYEFVPIGNGNETLFDRLMQKTNPKHVTYEMDVLWVHFPGQDPVALLKKYGKRWELMHIKDLRKGVQGNLSGGTDVKNDVILGTGQLDLPAILKAAKKAGVKYYFIEDESPTAASQITESLRFLEQVKW